ELKIIKSDLTSLTSLFNNNTFPLGGKLSLNLKNKIVIFSDYRPTFNYETFRNCISLKNDISCKINYWENKLFLSPKIIGVHIRFSDKKPSADIETLYHILNTI